MRLEFRICSRVLVSFENENDVNFDAANSALPAPLSKREIEVLRLIAHDATKTDLS